MKDSSPININRREIVNEATRADADRIEGNPEKMLALIDLIFGFEPDKFPQEINPCAVGTPATAYKIGRCGFFVSRCPRFSDNTRTKTAEKGKGLAPPQEPAQTLSIYRK